MARLFFVTLFMFACSGKTVSAPSPVTSVDQPASVTSTAPITIHFDWSPPCRVPITLKQAKKGHEAVFSYVIDVQAVGETLEVRMLEPDVISIDGAPLTDPAARAQVIAVSAASPTVLVDREGNYINIRGVEEMIDAVLKTMPAEKRELTSATMRSPEMRVLLEQKSGELWESWVGAWAGAEIAPGEAREVDGEIATPWGVVPAKVRVTHEGTVDGSWSKLRIEQNAEGPEIERMLEEMIAKMSLDAGKPGPPKGFTKGIRSTITTIVIIDPKTARPRDARIERTSVLAGETKIETKETRFDWSKAVGCKM
jgi:hypothetical protein